MIVTRSKRLKIIFPLFTTLLHFSPSNPIKNCKLAYGNWIDSVTRVFMQILSLFFMGIGATHRGEFRILLSHHQNTTTFHDNFSFFTVFLLEKRQILRPPAREFKWKLRISLSPTTEKKIAFLLLSCFFCFCFSLHDSFSILFYAMRTHELYHRVRLNRERARERVASIFS